MFDERIDAAEKILSEWRKQKGLDESKLKEEVLDLIKDLNPENLSDEQFFKLLRLYNNIGEDKNGFHLALNHLCAKDGVATRDIVEAMICNEFEYMSKEHSIALEKVRSIDKRYDVYWCIRLAEYYISIAAPVSIDGRSERSSESLIKDRDALEAAKILLESAVENGGFDVVYFAEDGALTRDFPKYWDNLWAPLLKFEENSHLLALNLVTRT